MCELTGNLGISRFLIANIGIIIEFRKNRCITEKRERNTQRNGDVERWG